MKALIIGATGATGKDLLDLLLIDNSFQQVDIFVRRDVNIKNRKLSVHVIDFDKPEQWKHLVKGDVLFSCMGTTLKTAGSKEAQWEIDYDYQFQFAKAAKENGVAKYVLISSVGANAKSAIFYSKMKGELEDDVKKLNFPKAIFFRPPMLERKNSDRSAEVIGSKIIRFLNSLGILNSQKPLPTEELAKAMINSVKKLSNGMHILNPPEIWNYSKP